MPEEKENKKSNGNGINSFFKQLTPKQWIMIIAAFLICQQGGNALSVFLEQLGLPVMEKSANDFLNFKDSLLTVEWKNKVTNDLETLKSDMKEIKSRLSYRNKEKDESKIESKIE